MVRTEWTWLHLKKEKCTKKSQNILNFSLLTRKSSANSKVLAWKLFKLPTIKLDPPWLTCHWAEQFLNLMKRRLSELKYDELASSSDPSKSEKMGEGFARIGTLAKHTRMCEQRWRAVSFMIGLNIAALQKKEKPRNEYCSPKTTGRFQMVLRAHWSQVVDALWVRSGKRLGVIIWSDILIYAQPFI